MHPQSQEAGDCRLPLRGERSIALRVRGAWQIPLFLAVASIFWEAVACAGAYRYQLLDPHQDPRTWRTVVGFMQVHTVGRNETLLDIARIYGLGFNEIQLLHPRTDPWIPGEGSDVAIPTQWVLPRTRHENIVINLPEMRLYQFFRSGNMVKTYPVGIGDAVTQTPEGTFHVVEQVRDPTWTIPASLREKHHMARVIPPGDQNPLGKYWLGMSCGGYGIHGTNFPWCVGRLVSNGCIRMYPEHIEELFGQVRPGEMVEIVYEPVKVGFLEGGIYLEVHPDVYGKIHGMEQYAVQRIEALADLESVSMESVRAALEACDGVPVLVGSFQHAAVRDLPFDRESGRERMSGKTTHPTQEAREENKG